LAENPNHWQLPSTDSLLTGLHFSRNIPTVARRSTPSGEIDSRHNKTKILQSASKPHQALWLKVKELPHINNQKIEPYAKTC
jgi:hypothetical protein